MADQFRRRDVVAGVGVLALSGCLRATQADSQPTESPSQDDQTVPPSTGQSSTASTGIYPQFQYDAANTGAVGESSVAGFDGASWRFESGATVQTPPVVWGDTVFLSTDSNRLYAVSLAGGEPRWSFSAPTWSVPAVASGTVVVGGQLGPLTGIDAESAEQTWRTESLWGAPTIGTDGVYALTGNYGVARASLADGETQWSFEPGLGNDLYGPPAVRDGVLYVAGDGGDTGTGYVHAVDATSGEEQWRRELGPVHAAVTAGADAVFVPTAAGTVHALDPATGDDRWTLDAGDTANSVAVSDGVVYSSSGKRFTAVDVASGDEQWRRDDVGGGVPPLVAGDVVFTADRTGVVALDTNSGETVDAFSFDGETVVGLAKTPDQLVATTYQGSVVGVALQSTT